jgi:hypothetical protein
MIRVAILIAVLSVAFASDTVLNDKENLKKSDNGQFSDYGPFDIEFTHVGRIVDPKCIRGDFVAMRILRNNGQVESDVVERTRYFNERRQYPMFHVSPCVSCGNITEQAIAVCKKVLKPAYHAVPTRFVYIDVTNPLSWSKNKNDNIEVIKKFAILIDGCNDHYSPAIFTTKDSWEAITGSYSGFSDLPLWYTNLDGRRDHVNFVPFGGWQKPDAKTHTLIGRDECGNEEVMLGFI